MADGTTPQWDAGSQSAQVVAGDAIRAGWQRIERLGTIGPRSRRARRFRRFGDGSAICFPVAALYGEEYIELGEGCIIGPYCSLSAGVMPGQVLDHSPVVTIGDRVLIGKGSGIVGHHTVEIGDDVFTGHHVYITDANHGYEDRRCRSASSSRRRARCASAAARGSVTAPWCCPVPHIGRNVAVGAGSVVTGALPDFSVAVGNPARVIRRYVEGDGWVRVDHAAGDAH